MNRRIVFSLIAVLGGVTLLAALWSLAAWRPSFFGPELSSGAETPIASPTTPDPPALLSMRVVVRDAETAEAIADANVQIGEEQGETNQRGVYALNVKNGVAHTVWVRAPRYLDWREQVDVSSHEPTTLIFDIALQPNEVPGQVVGDRAEPLPDARLLFNGQQVPLNGNGDFVLRRIAIGDKISVVHPGYEQYRASYDGRPLLLALTPISVAVGVRDRMTGQGVPGALVCADGGVCASTGDAGQALLRGVVDDVTLVVQREGYFSTTLSYLGGDALAVELAPRQLYGVVRDAESGQPLTRTVLLVNGQVVPLEGGGRYRLPDLTQVHSLFVKSPGHKRITIPMDSETTTKRYDVLDACLEPKEYPCVDIHLPRFAVRGIYVNFNLLMWSKDRVLELIDLVDRSPILNAIVVDIKGDRGYIAFESDDPIVASGNAMSTPRLPLTDFLRICKEKHIYTVARMVIFKDNELIVARPELAVRHPNGAIFYDREGLAWGDPTLEEVWEYNIAITEEAIRLGFDEIQYDYLRYPSDSTSLAVVRALVYSVPSTLESRTAAIEGFVAAAKAAVDPTPAFLSADLFGFALSVDPEHDMRIGQRLMDLAPHVDYVCPMVYPSTFIPGNLGLESPSDHPYQVVAISMEYGLSRTDTLIRPWLQHYWYDRYEIAEQRRAAEEASDVGWCYWNAGGQYDELFFVPPQGLEP